MITHSQLQACMPHASTKNITKFLQPLNDAMQKYEIGTPRRIAAFIAQLMHESGSFVYVRELASGEAYEGRKDLGNTEPGDGPRYKGRGLIQITGRANYTALKEAFNVDFVAHPELVEKPQYACLSAGWFWNLKRLNALADWGTIEAYKLITKKINGGYNGWKDRLANYHRCLDTLGAK